MFRSSLFVSLLLSCLLGACGGGSGSGEIAPAGLAKLDGAVAEIDGATSGLGGTEFVLVETGQRVWTAPDGTFSISSAPAGSITLALASAPGASALTGAQVYADNCSVCHGTDGSGPPNARGKTDAEVRAALARGAMASIALTTEEYDAVFAFLSDGGTPPPPPPPPPPPSGETGGEALYNTYCAACHGDFDAPANAAGGNRQVLGARVCTIEGSIGGTSVFPGGVPEMAGLESLSDEQISDIATYLNSKPVTGQERYVTNCAGCHGMTGDGGRTGEDVLGESAAETREAIGDEGEMRYLSCLPSSDLDQIGAYLQGLDDDDSDDDDSDDDDSDDDDSDDDDSDDDDADDDDDGAHDDDDRSHEGEADEDEIDDGDECSDTEISLHRVRSGEHIRLRVRIRDGRLERVDVSRSDRDEREVELCLTRTDANDDPDMKGRLEVERREDRTRFELEVEHATPGRNLELVVIDPDGIEESQGLRTVDLDGEAKWELRAADLPFGVSSVAELEGYGVVVRDATAGVDLLVGEVPELPVAAPGGDGGHDEGGRARGKSRLMSHESGVEGYVEIHSRPEEARERFKVEAEHLEAGREVEFFVEDGVGSDRFTSIGTRVADAEGEAELDLDTGDGDGLPGGATSVAALVGLGVQVRDASTGALLLDGTVPALAAD